MKSLKISILHHPRKNSHFSYLKRDNMKRRSVRLVVFFMFGLCILLNIVNASDGTGDYIHYRLGVKYKNEKKYDKAIDEFRKVLAAYPDNYNAYFHMAEIRNQQKRPRLVIYNLKKALSYNPGWSRAQKMLAGAYERDGQYQKAILELQQYQQVSDPAERDSIQHQIDRLIGKVSGNNVSAATEKEAAVEEVKQAKGVAGSTVSSTKNTAKQKSVKKKSSPSKSAAKNVDSYFTQAVELYNNEKFDESLKKLKQVLALQPGHAGAYYYAGLIRYRKKQNSMALINFRKGLAYPELGFNAHYYLGKIYGEDKKYATAITHLFKYIEKTTYEPGKKEAQQLIEKYRKKGGSAVLDAVAPGKPVEMMATDTMAPKERYYTLELRIDSLLTMMTVDTLSEPGRQLLEGIRAFTSGRYDDAIQEFKKVLAKHPSGTVAVHCLYNTGICYLKLRLLKEAENQFQQILERYVKHPVAAKGLFLKGVTYLERSESKTAEKLFRRFIQNYRNHQWIGNAYEKLGDAYVDMEQHRKAVDAYSQAVSLGRKNIDKVAALFKLGKTYQELGNGNRAITTYQKAIDLGEKNTIFLRVPDSYYRIADELYKMKEYKKALNYYTKVTRKYPSFQETPWGIFQIGSIQKNLGKFQNAIKAFKELIKQYPDDYWARQAKWKMEDAIWEYEYKAVLR
jgi:tetratricopeptide (TPR) repeat protein